MDRAPPTENRGPMLVRATWIITAIGLPFLVARVCARLKHVGRLSWDDYLMILSLVSMIPGSLGICWRAPGVCYHRWGRHYTCSTLGLRPTYLSPHAGTIHSRFQDRLRTLAHRIHVPSVWARVICSVFAHHDLYKAVPTVASVLCIAGQFVANVAVIGVGLFGCTPVQKKWDRRIPGTSMTPGARTFSIY
jgi:hypothetical protein